LILHYHLSSLVSNQQPRSFEPTSWWYGLMEPHECDESRTLFKIHAEWLKYCHRFCKTLSQQKHIVLQSMVPLQLKRFKVGSKMAIAASAPVLPNQKKQCFKIARFTNTSCIYV
jgi:hypothetical protein